MKKTNFTLILFLFVLDISAQNFSFSNSQSGSLVNLNSYTVNNVQTTYDTLSLFDTYDLLSQFLIEEKSDSSVTYLNYDNSEYQIESEFSLAYNDPVFETILIKEGIKRLDDDKFVKKSVKSISSETRTNLPILQVQAETKNKTISGSTQTTFKREKFSHLISIGASVSGEKDFANIFESGEISSKGNLTFTYGIGNFIHDTKIEMGKPNPTLKETNFWLLHFSTGPTFSKFSNNIEEPSTSLVINKRSDTYWTSNIGLNTYFHEPIQSIGANFLISGNFKFGKTDNVGSLKKGNLINIVEDSSLINSILEIPSSVLIGKYENFNFNTFSLDMLVTFNWFKSIGIYTNVSTTNFEGTELIYSRTTNSNFGIIFLKSEKDKSTKSINKYTPTFGFIFGWTDLGNKFGRGENDSNFNFGITANFNFGKYNLPKRKSNSTEQK